MLSPNWRVKDEKSEAVLSTPSNQGRWRRETSNGFHVDENRPATNPHKTTNGKCSNKEYDPRAARTTEERSSISGGVLLSKTTNQDVDDFPSLTGDAVEPIKMGTDLLTRPKKPYRFPAPPTKDPADRAPRNPQGAAISGQPISVEPVTPGFSRREAHNSSAESHSSDELYGDTVLQRQKSSDAVDSWSYEATRLLVLDLPVRSSYYDFGREIQEFFGEFKVYVHEVKNRKKNPYVYVDLRTPEQARDAKFAKDGAHAWGGPVRVQFLGSSTARKPDTAQQEPRARVAEPSTECPHVASNVRGAMGSFFKA